MSSLARAHGEEATLDPAKTEIDAPETAPPTSSALQELISKTLHITLPDKRLVIGQLISLSSTSFILTNTVEFKRPPVGQEEKESMDNRELYWPKSAPTGMWEALDVKDAEGVMASLKAERGSSRELGMVAINVKDVVKVEVDDGVAEGF